jgi:hypothetical protein
MLDFACNIVYFAILVCVPESSLLCFRYVLYI